MTLVTFRVKVKELNFFHRMADFYWKSGLIPEPSLRALARVCLNMAANKWSGLEEESYNQYIERVIAEAEGTYRQLAGNPASRFGGIIPTHLRRGPPIEKIEVPWW